MARQVLIQGDKGPEVKELQEILWEIGSVGPDNPFWRSRVARNSGVRTPRAKGAKKFFCDGDFGSWSVEAVKHAQLRLLGPRKMPLDQLIDTPGVVDLDTWWALENALKGYQDQGVERTVVHGPKQARLGPQIVSAWNYYISLGVKEVPKGSNRGPDMSPFSYSYKNKYKSESRFIEYIVII